MKDFDGDFKNILIVKSSSLGDIVHCLPIPRILKKRWPDARISWFVNDNYRELLAGHEFIDELIVFDRDRWRGSKAFGANLKDFYGTLKQVRQKRFDLVLDFQGIFRSALITLFSGAAVRVGFKDARELAFLAYNRRIKTDKQHCVERYLDMAHQVVGGDVSPVFDMTIGEQDALWVERQLDREGKNAGKKIITICPGARWTTKCWPVEHYARLAAMLCQKHNCYVVVCGTGGDFKAGEFIREAADPERVLNLCGKTNIKQLCGIIKNSDLLISNDSGPMHIAAAFNTQLIAIFGPTDPEKTGPYSGSCTIVRAEKPCVPCFLRQCGKPDDEFCMSSVSAEHIFLRIEDFI